MTNTPAPDAVISKTASSTLVRTNDVITYTLTVEVTVGTVSDTVVTDVMPMNIQFVSFGVSSPGTYNPSTRTLTWSLGSLAPGTYTLSYDGQVDAYVQEGVVMRNSAQVTSSAGTRVTHLDVELARTYTVHVGVYNEAGELVKDIWVQRLSQKIEDFSILENPVIASLNDFVYLEYQGVQIATWDGTNEEGDPVTNGKYHLKIDNVDPYGTVTNVSQEVTVSRSIARVGVRVYNSAGEVVRDLYSFMEDPCGTVVSATMTPTPCQNPLSGVSVSTNVLVPQAVGTPGPNGELKITSQGGLNVTWDGKGDEGQVVQSGHYEVEVHYTDGQGGEETVSIGVVVQKGNSDPGNYLSALPNHLTGGQASTTITVNDPGATQVTVSLYNLAGELIRQVRGTTPNQAVLDFSGLSSGLYFAVTEVRDASGKFITRKILKISCVK